MKTRFPSILGVFAAILMVASFVVPMNIAAPAAVTADPGIMKWDTVATPGSVFGKNDLANYHYTAVPQFQGMGSELQDIAVANDGMTIYGIGRGSLGPLNDGLANPALFAFDLWVNALAKTTSNGIAFSTATTTALNNTTGYGYAWGPTAAILPVNAYNVAVAPDDPKFVAITSDPELGIRQGPRRVWVSADGGSNWELAFNGGTIAAPLNGLAATEFIRDIDISIDWGGKRDIGFVTQNTNAAIAGRWFVRSSSGFNNWSAQAQPNTTAFAIQYYAIRFSPTYAGDASIGLVYATPVGTALPDCGTFFNVALRDLNQNLTTMWAYPAGVGVEVVNPSWPGQGRSPATDILNNAWLQLPSDFSGQSSSLRRAYISLDAFGATAGNAAGNKNDGIFRIDDTTVYMLMDTSSQANKSIYSIAYFGTYASGKLLAGERMGFPCTATVPTWFTDSPTTCPIPCWYPALKPTTGAAAQGTCAVGSQTGVGAALVGWNADGSLGLAATGSNPVVGFGSPYWVRWISRPIANDESALAISRNNGETWNQISFIDTTIDWFNDVAVAPDCTTIYLASVNRNASTAGVVDMPCNSFDSVWRSTINPNVAAPLPAIPPLGFYWERVFTHTTSYSCAQDQIDLPILRLVPSCTDKKDGEIVGWASQGSGTLGTGFTGAGVMAWSPDYGDYWAMLTPRYRVQDFAFESSTTLYVVNDAGLVQRMPYTGTAWSTSLAGTDTTLLGAHTIVAVPDGKVLVGAAAAQNYQVAYSADKGVTYSLVLDSLSTAGNEHVIFDVDFKNNSFIYMGDDSGTIIGSVYRNTVPSYTRWQDSDMMAASNGNGTSITASVTIAGVVSDLLWPTGTVRPPHAIGQFGIAQAWTGEPQPALYSAHDNTTVSIVGSFTNSAVCRTLGPRYGIPKPGIYWDCLDIFAPINTTNVRFTLEPTSLKYCGCCTLDTNTTLYAIDNESGNALRWNSAAPTATTPARTGRFKWDPGYDPVNRRGMLWAYTDCLAKKGPILKGPADKFLVGADPVSGRNQQVDLSWEQLCLSTYYQLQIAKDANFLLRINPAVNNAGTIAAVTGSILITMDPYNMTAPAAWIAPGALPEAGAIYYWRVRSARSATLQIASSPWSEGRSFTVKAGFIVNTPYYGVQLLAPNNGCLGCKIKPASFSWSPWKEATKYQFDLATDPEFKSLVVTATTTTTGYEYSGTLNYSTNYFWRVKALEVNGQNIPSDWSATFSLQTEPAPAPPAPPPAEPATPVWVWVIIAIGAILVIVTLVLIFKTRRV